MSLIKPSRNLKNLKNRKCGWIHSPSFTTTILSCSSARKWIVVRNFSGDYQQIIPLNLRHYFLYTFSCDQLFETYSKRSPKPVYEPKKNINSKPSAEDEKYLQEKYQELETILSHQRVVKHGNVSLAEYSNGRIAVTQKVGKWEKFGFSVRNEQYLYPHEALFLVEIVRTHCMSI